MQYTSGTRAVLEAEDGLCNPEVKLPQRIRDAMSVTREIGLRYLWVDALCILQDDEDDIIENISHAGRIYGGAALNIVASTNLNPNYGLPGVSSVPRSKGQIQETVQGMRLATILHDPRRRLDDIEDSIWNSRAWTYQKRQLSPRNVYFTVSEMVFMSRHVTFFEDTVPGITSELKPTPILEPFNTNPRNIEWQIWTDPTQRQYPNKAFETCDGISMMIAADPDQEDRRYDPAPTYRITRLSGPQLPGRLRDNADGLTLWEQYAKAVSPYTKRDMTLDADAVRAFAGMEYLIAKGVNTRFWNGVPEFAFDRALLWCPNEPVKRRKQDNKALFPSWSWAAWKGQTSYKSKGWYNSQYHGPVSIVNWFQNLAREDFLARFSVEPNSGRPMADIIDELGLERLLTPLDPRELMKLVDADHDGWIAHIDEASNQHYFTHEAYPGTCFDYPVNLPGQKVIERPDVQGMLHFSAQTAPVRLCDMTTARTTAEPPEDDFIQIGINDENRSANYRPSWKRILYHQGYRCGFLVLNIPFHEMASAPEEEDQYHLAAISRDSLPEIPTPGFRSAIYRAMDPRQVHHCVSKESKEDEPLASYIPPDATAPPDTDPVGEDGNPHWDQGRFPIRMAYPIYNVLLLRKEEDEDCWERVGVGKMHLHAFHLARPEGRLICLK